MAALLPSKPMQALCRLRMQNAAAHGRPWVLHTTYSVPPLASFEGQAVRDEQIYAPQGSAIGPY